MKKIIIFILLTMATMTSFAQIAREHMGFTLGKTTKSELMAEMQREGFDCKDKDDCCEVVGITYNDMKWTNVEFAFNDSILCGVVFVQDEEDYNKAQCDSLLNSVEKKYDDYQIFSLGIIGIYVDDETAMLDINQGSMALAFVDKNLLTTWMGKLMKGMEKLQKSMEE